MPDLRSVARTSAAHDSVVALLMRIAAAALWLVITVLLARWLTVADFGQVQYIVAFSLAFGQVCVIGYDTTVLREGTTRWTSGDDAGFSELVLEARVVALTLGLALTAALVALAGWSWLAPISPTRTVGMLTGLITTVTAVMIVQRDVLRSTGRVGRSLFGITIGRLAPFLAIIVIAVRLDQRSVVVIVGAYAASLFFAFVVEAFSVHRLGVISGSLRFQHFKVSLATSPGDVLVLVLVRGVGLVIGLRHGLEAAALFFAAERLGIAGQFLNDAIITAYGPRIAEVRDRLPQLRAVVREVSLMLAAVFTGSLAIVTVGAVVGLRIMGDDFNGAVPLLLLLVAANARSAVFGPVALIMTMTDLSHDNSVIQGVVAAMLLPMLWWSPTALWAVAAFAAMSWLAAAASWLVLRQRRDVVSGILPTLGARHV